MPYRPNSGRKKGGINSLKNNTEAAEILKLNSVNLVNKAIALATGKEPDRIILSKLIDKILPSLNSGSLDMTAKIKGSLNDLSEETLKDMVVEFSKYAAEANSKLEAKKKKVE